MSKERDMSEQIQQLFLEKIVAHPDNRRVGGFDPVKLEQLAASIRDVGVQQPIIVRKHLKNGGFELVARERRWRAAKLAGLTEIPAIVRELDDLQVLKIQTIENLQREDVHPLDEADGFARLMDKAGYEVEQVAQELGKSVSYVYQRLKLKDLVPEARKLFVDGEITAGHAILIARLQPDQQKACITQGLRHWREDDMPSVRRLDGWIRQNVLMELSRVTWKLDDAELLPAAGPCTLCPKRTGFHPQLFADVCNGKKDFCTDRACFAAKGQAMVERRRVELQGVKHLEVRQGYGDYREEAQDEKKGILKSYDWNECKKNEPGAQRVIVVAGDSPGRLTWGKKRAAQSSYSYKRSPAEKARQQKEELKRKQETAFRKALYEQIVAKAQKQISAGLPFDILQLAVTVFWKHTWDDLQARIMKWEGWEVPKSNTFGGREKLGTKKIAAMNEGALTLMLVKLALAPEVEVMQWSGDKAGDLRAAAEIYGVDVAAVRKEALASLKGPKLTNVSEDGKAAKRKTSAGVCRVCGCTDKGCSQCIKKTGKPCHWVDAKHTLCSACAYNPRFHGMKPKTATKKAARKRIPEKDRAIGISAD